MHRFYAVATLFYTRILVSMGALESVSHCHLGTTIVYVSAEAFQCASKKLPRFPSLCHSNWLYLR